MSAKDACTHVFWLQILSQCSSLWAPFVTQLHFLCCVFGYLYCRWWTSSGDSFTHRYATKYECNECMQFYRATHNIPEEDILGSYSRVLLKMFLAEGIMCGHALFLASASEDPVEMIKVQIHIGFPLCPKKTDGVCMIRGVLGNCYVLSENGLHLRIYLRLWGKKVLHHILGSARAAPPLPQDRPKWTKWRLLGDIKTSPKFKYVS